MGDGLYTFRACLYWASTRRIVSHWHDQKLGLQSSRQDQSMGSFDRVFDHSKHLHDKEFILSLALARLEYRQKGHIDLPCYSKSPTWYSGSTDLREKISKEYVEKGQTMGWWRCPRQVEDFVNQHLKPGEVKELQALLEGRGSEKDVGKYEHLI